MVFHRRYRLMLAKGGWIAVGIYFCAISLAIAYGIWIAYGFGRCTGEYCDARPLFFLLGLSGEALRFLAPDFYWWIESLPLFRWAEMPCNLLGVYLLGMGVARLMGKRQKIPSF